MSRRPGSFLSPAALLAAMLAMAPAGSGALAQSPSPSAAPSVAASVPATPGTSPVPAPSPLSGPLAGIEILVRGERDPDAVVPDEDLAAVVDGNTAFALDLYREVASEPGNLVLGPLSISTAMAMNQMGLRGTSETQTAAGMHFDVPADRLAAGFDRLLRELDGLAGPKLRLSLVNQLFGQRDYPFEEPFLYVLGRRFGAPMAVVDYISDPDAVRALINAWVESKTNKRIKDLLPPGSIDEFTRLVLVNAIYLKADWAVPFNAAFTEDRPFHLATGKTVKVPMMRQEHFSGQIGSGEGYRAIELPYVGDRLAMLVVVPDDLATFEPEFTPGAYGAIVASLDQDGAVLTMPTFSARTQVDLIDPLKALGITDIFDKYLADLSGIGTIEHLYVSAAVHQAFVKVAEKGTEAAAATAIGDSATSGPPPPFRIDRPFLWFIRDRDTGAVLFMGRVVDPRDTVK